MLVLVMSPGVSTAETGGIRDSTGMLVIFSYLIGCPGTRGVFVAPVEMVSWVVLMTVTGGQLGHSSVTVRTLSVPVAVPGTTGTQIEQTLVRVSVDVAGVVVVTKGPLEQNWVTVSTLGVDGLVIVTAGQVGQG